MNQLRNRDIGTKDFRKAAKELSILIASEIASQISHSLNPTETPFSSTKGESPVHRVVLIPILRAGVVFLTPFLDLFPEAPVGLFGIHREEKTAFARLYYENLPPLASNDQILLLDPMLATGGSAVLSLQKLKEKSANLSQITLVTMLAAPEGIRAVEKSFPETKIYTVAVDEKLDSNNFIFPGLGDFGDRYFGTYCT